MPQLLMDCQQQYNGIGFYLGSKLGELDNVKYLNILKTRSSRQNLQISEIQIYHNYIVCYCSKQSEDEREKKCMYLGAFLN
jgi:hypothetical protein